MIPPLLGGGLSSSVHYSNYFSGACKFVAGFPYKGTLIIGFQVFNRVKFFNSISIAISLLVEGE
ncbi:hypothetical protein VCRA2119O147_3820003 [Vibrio crassostreae]|nr:hypothetical protein VCRA2110O175_10492 [Vibrio crassostreae]CAK1881628.1 hypothetical protein VCRA2110O175_10498 [Vibrio crassostreae]CAK1931112.1 hypothetical protein VCRA2118O236_260044 [Vibrio crassostreae]CAK1955747.1 hypothetical protein VCRA2113O204_250043 [Vibrio crassostreae]CAK1956485.1 hypothetical protein VCRA2113O204_250049 [Vibrio crassostreae]